MKNLHVDYYDITSYHADFTQQLTIASLFCFLQESAWRHANSRGFGWSHLAERSEFWVLAKMHVRIRRMPDWTEKIRSETWGKMPELLTAFRDFEFFDAGNQSIILATSSWHILNMQTHRPTSLSHFADDFPIVNRYAIEEKPQKIQIPASNPVKSAVFPIFPSDIDMNLHVNNTRYVQWAMDCVPFEFQKQHALCEISVNFLSEARMGERYFIETYQNEWNFTHLIVSEKENRKLAAVQSKWECRL
ncbi:MAG: thioesterase [Lentimicrobiaceae bacterium]|nr:thioesterase [Lentimicrobiaceae bacterium]